ncbi:hypothetical protein KXW58_006114 [Aspergillus fumigatus]|nr:hypothetical protein KXW58_006114 [Aspergillus fumigatus]
MVQPWTVGQEFYYKTKHFVGPLQELALEDKVSRDFELFYPDGPWPAPGGEELDVRAWGFGDFEHGLIKGLDTSILKILDILDLYGPFDGIMGFSTGAAIAAIIASLLERPERIRMFIGETPIAHPQFQFVVCFSGFKLGNLQYGSLYSPKLESPSLHLIGVLDTMIAGHLTEDLSAQFMNSLIQRFFGAHYVPKTDRTNKAVGRFILNWSRQSL